VRQKVHDETQPAQTSHKYVAVAPKPPHQVKQALLAEGST
jgi:hypothetical protein